MALGGLALMVWLRIVFLNALALDLSLNNIFVTFPNFRLRPLQKNLTDMRYRFRFFAKVSLEN